MIISLSKFKKIVYKLFKCLLFPYSWKINFTKVGDRFVPDRIRLGYPKKTKTLQRAWKLKSDVAS